MTILVVGGGGREHAIVRKLRESPRAGKIYCAPGNGGISAEAECVPVRATDVETMVGFAVSHGVDFAFVAQDDPLVLGMVDAMEQQGITCFGPSKLAAEVEGSKVFSKDLMKRYGIPTAAHEVFDGVESALEYIREKNEYPAVIKTDGLALGKGVILAQDYDEASAAVRMMLEEKKFGESGSRIVVEEFLTGPEVTVLAFTDGEALVPMVSSMDHKRVFDGDRGLNTGGMGAIAPSPLYTPEIAAVCMEKIFLPTIRAMKKEGRRFKGCLYFGLMLTPKGPYVIEYNCRFGDPEAQAVLALLQSDLLEIALAVAEERLDTQPVVWREGAAACVVAASGGYPESYETGFPIAGLDPAGQLPGANVFHAGTRLEDGVFRTSGGRVLGVTCTGTNLPSALEAAYSAMGKISFDKMHYRTDIGRLRQTD